MNDTATIQGIRNNPDFITFNTADEIAAYFADDRDEVDTLLAFIAGDLDDTEATEFLDGMEAASRARYTDEELARIEAEHAAAAKQRELEARRRKAREDHPCRKCGGSGELPHYHYIENGNCFRCDGLGIDPGASYGGEDIIG